MAKKVKRKLNLKRTLFFLLLFYIIIYGCYYLINRPIRHIVITGNELVLDSEILRVSKLKNYPTMFKYSSKTLEKKISNIKLIEHVKVKKGLNNTIKIIVEESKLLFYYQDKIVLSNSNLVKKDIKNLYGIPTFINKIDNDLLIKFIKNFREIDDNIIFEMNEIEYYPLISDEGKIISEDRFKIVMNDGNTIITDIKSVSVMNKYNDIYASLGERKGTINLDGNEVNNLVFIPYEE